MRNIIDLKEYIKSKDDNVISNIIELIDIEHKSIKKVIEKATVTEKVILEDSTIYKLKSGRKAIEVTTSKASRDYTISILTNKEEKIYKKESLSNGEIDISTKNFSLKVPVRRKVLDKDRKTLIEITLHRGAENIYMLYENSADNLVTLTSYDSNLNVISKMRGIKKEDYEFYEGYLDKVFLTENKYIVLKNIDEIEKSTYKLVQNKKCMLKSKSVNKKEISYACRILGVEFDNGILSVEDGYNMMNEKYKCFTYENGDKEIFASKDISVPYLLSEHFKCLASNQKNLESIAREVLEIILSKEKAESIEYISGKNKSKEITSYLNYSGDTFNAELEVTSNVKNMPNINMLVDNEFTIQISSDLNIQTCDKEKGKNFNDFRYVTTDLSTEKSFSVNRREMNSEDEVKEVTRLGVFDNADSDFVSLNSIRIFHKHKEDTFLMYDNELDSKDSTNETCILNNYIMKNDKLSDRFNGFISGKSIGQEINIKNTDELFSNISTIENNILKDILNMPDLK